LRQALEGIEKNSKAGGLYYGSEKTYFAFRTTVLRDMGGGAACGWSTAGGFRDSRPNVSVGATDGKYRPAADGQHDGTADRKHDAASQRKHGATGIDSDESGPAGCDQSE
jgi:hypothetical protein